MGNRKIGIVLLGLILLLVVPLALDDSVFADPKHKRISLEDLGILQLAAHDFFNVDRTNGVDFENGKLDLSTLFENTITGEPFDDETIEQGGEFRNRENIMLFTVASEFGQIYLGFLDDFENEDVAKEKTVKVFHQRLQETYERTFDEHFPNSQEGDATMAENLALRTVHDFLPGHIKINGKMTMTLNPSLHGMTLSDSDLEQLSDKLDGKFDHEFRMIRIFIPPDVDMVIDLLELDSNFAEQFDTDGHTFEEFLSELRDGSYDEDEEVTKLIRDLFAKGLNI